MSSAAIKACDNATVNAALTEQNALLKTQVAALEQQLDWFKRQLFGRRSEKRLIEPNPDQPVLEGWATQDNSEPASPRETITYTRRKKQRGENDVNDQGLRFDDTVPVETIRCAAQELDGPNADQYEVISEKVTHRLAQRPGSFVVLKYVRPVLKRKGDGKLRTTAAPAGLWAGSVADVSVIAGLLVEKFVYHQPLYRQHQRLSREGIQLSRATLTTWAHKAIDLLSPIFDAQRRSVLQSKVLAVDETPIKAGRKKKGQMRLAWYWPMYGDQDEVVFTYSRTRGHQHLLDTLTGFEGTLLTDGHGAYTRYVRQRPTLIHAQCWAHTRREFIKAQKAEPEAAAAALEQIGQLYHIEAQLKKHEADDATIRRERRDRARPVAEAFFEWCDEQTQRMDLVPSNPLSKALKYAMKREAPLSVYLGDPKVAIDTNHLERTLRVIPMGRKAWQFCWSEVGAEKVGVVQSLLTTCRLHDVHPYHYLVDVLQRVGEHPMSRVDELMPRHWKTLFADQPLRSDVHLKAGQ
jgi:transposase